MESNPPPMISLSNPAIKSDILKTTVNYIIKTEDLNNKYESTRTYDEFLSLRKILSQKWPGTFIPPIPPKSLLSNFSSKYVKTYKIQLEDFLNYIKTLNFLYNSEEFQCFLRSKGPFTLKFSSSISDISLTYQAIFHEYAGRVLNPTTLDSLKEEISYLEISLQGIIDLRDRSEVLMDDFKKFHTLLASSSNDLEKTEKLFFTSPEAADIFTHPDLTLIKNNFYELYVWTEREILQIECLMEALQYVEKLQKSIHSIEASIEGCKNELTKIGKNQISIAKVFSFKSKDRFLEDKNQEIATKQNEIMNMRNFQTIIVLRLIEKDIPSFKASRLSTFEKMKEKYNETVLKSLEVLRSAANKTLLNISKSKHQTSNNLNVPP